MKEKQIGTESTYWNDMVPLNLVEGHAALLNRPKSSPLELQATVPDYQIPFVPIIQEGEQPFSMLADLHKKYNWVLETRSYDSIDTLMKALKPGIIDPAIKMHYELRLIKAKEQSIHPLRYFIDK